MHTQESHPYSLNSQVNCKYTLDVQEYSEHPEMTPSTLIEWIVVTQDYRGIQIKKLPFPFSYTTDINLVICL